MKVTYEFKVTEKTALNRKKFCSKCGSHVFKVFEQTIPDMEHSDIGFMFHVECADCGHEGKYDYSKRRAIRRWKKDE